MHVWLCGGHTVGLVFVICTCGYMWVNTVSQHSAELVCFFVICTCGYMWVIVSFGYFSYVAMTFFIWLKIRYMSDKLTIGI